MNPQATRRTSTELRAAQARRRQEAERPPETFTWQDALGFLAVAAAWVALVACIYAWITLPESWPLWSAALAPIAWGKPDRIAGRMVCESIERTMPHTPWRWERRHGFSHSAACAFAWLFIAFLFLSVAALAAAK